MIVGEGLSEKDLETGIPFSGSSGWLLDLSLAQVGISRKECYLTNIFNLRVGHLKNICGTKAEGIRGLPALDKGRFLLPAYAPELTRLYSEIRRESPNVIIALGSTAAWALLHSTGIRAIRGATAGTHPLLTSQLGRVFKVLPTYSPAAINREWSLRPIFLSDLDKAKSGSSCSDVRRPSRRILINPTLEDIASYDRDFIQPATRLSADI